MAKVLRHILAVLCLLAAVFFLLPLGMGIVHFGMLWPAAVLQLAAAVLAWPDFFRRLLRPRWLRGLVCCLAAVCLTAILVTLGKMAACAAHRPAEGQDCTVVVLGCQVFPDGRPSLMLQGRIDAAYDYLTAHPDAVCIASGGQNGSEPISEALCIRDALVDRGIDPSRILLEDASRSTEENLAFSARLMNSYLKLDYPAMRRWLGGDHAAFAAEYYVLGNKINAFGDLYVYFYYAKDAAGNTFTVDVHADKNGEKISEIDVYVSADRNDADKQLAIWKEYARDYADKGLGAFKEAYTTDSWGDRKETFADLAAAVAHVESNGRPGPFDGGIIVVFEADGVATNLVMNQQYIYLLIKDPNYNVE